MANCSSGNQTLDPYQTILDETSDKINTLENQSGDILPFVDEFRTIGDAFPPSSISPSNVVDSALNEFTADAICAGLTDIAPINDLAEDCLNDALKGVRKYIGDILGNVEDGIDLIADILVLPENTMMKLFQKIWKLCDNITGLINSIDGKLQCISLSDQAANYQGQIDDLIDRVTSVTDDLYLSSDGSFDPDTLMNGFQDGLKDNLNAYKTRADNLQTEIGDNITNTVDLSATINPKRYF